MMDFEMFFRTVNGGKEPFPWQKHAAQRLIDGSPLQSVTVPTGCGKTAMIEAALFHAAHGGPRRVFFIIDRRVVVDEAHRRAIRIRDCLANPRNAEMEQLAQRLGPIRVVRLRGGVRVDQDWCWHPEDTVVVLSTVDQVGSRLLFRGYGVSPRSWPLHAAFVGTKALYLVDEAHLSRPFAQTVRSAIHQGADINLIEMTATPVEGETAGVGLSAADRECPELQQRLAAAKLARLAETGNSDREFSAAAVEKALDLSRPGAVIGVVVNTVKAAREVWKGLNRKKLGQVLLLTGRARAFDKDRLMEKWLDQIRTGRARTEAGEPLFVVATQTIEVGADLDFDALVSEAAPLSALRQRFGRLDRLGELGNSSAWILARQKNIDEKSAEKASVYGADIFLTWNWLRDTLIEDVVDFGPSAMEQILTRKIAPAENIPVCPQLLRPHLEALSQTGRHAPQISPAPWLHGPERPSNEISVVWRADLHPEKSDQWKERVSLLPPLAQEAVQIPLGALRDLLAKGFRSELSDLEGAEPAIPDMRSVQKLVLRWRGDDGEEEGGTRRVTAQQLRPGDTVVIPAAYGGLDEFGWTPDSDEPPVDVAEACALEQEGLGQLLKRPFFLRLTSSTHVDAKGRSIGSVWHTVAHPDIEDNALNKALEQAFILASELRSAYATVDEEEGFDEKQLDAEWKVLTDHLATIRHPFVAALGEKYDYSIPVGDGVILISRPILEQGGGLTAGVPVPLDEHLTGVSRKAEDLSRLDPETKSVVKAAGAHDLGKTATAFQVMLWGDPSQAAMRPPLAKSGYRRPEILRAAYKASGLPKGFRHELFSVELSPELSPLEKHLVATHHGHGRPWFPPCEDLEAPGARLANIDSDWRAQFSILRNSFGPWRLAELESLLRSADIQRTIEEQQ